MGEFIFIFIYDLEKIDLCFLHSSRFNYDIIAFFNRLDFESLV